MTDEAAAAQPEDETRKREELQDAAELAAETLGHDLLQALVNELQATKEWASRSEIDQNTSIERLRQRVHKLVGEALQIMLLQEYPVVVATVAGVRFQKGIRVVLAVDKHAQSRHELADAEGKSVLVLIADPDELRDGMSKIRAAAKQGELFNGDAGLAFGSNYTGGDERPFRRDEPGTDAQPDPTATVENESQAQEPAAPPVELELERDPLWKQAVDGLRSIGMDIDEEKAKEWTEAQCTEAAYFVTISKDGNTVKIPTFIHEALLPHQDEKAEKRRRRRGTASDSGKPADGAQ